MNYWGASTIGYSGEEYALRYADVKFRQRQADKVIIFDCGANVGQFAELAFKEISSNKIIYSFML